MPQSTEHSQNHLNGSLHPEKDKLPLLFLGVLLVGLAVLMVFVFFSAKQLVWISTSLRKEAVDTSVSSPELTENKLKWNEELSSYSVVDEALGLYRIPVDAAIGEYVKQQSAQ
jgi:acyl-CoA synthetase (AMP-forming)/AMP-acid ligase II